MKKTIIKTGKDTGITLKDCTSIPQTPQPNSPKPDYSRFLALAEKWRSIKNENGMYVAWQIDALCVQHASELEALVKEMQIK